MMTWKECLEWQAKEKAFLDTKDLKPFITKDKSIYDIMEDIEDAFQDEYQEEGFIFNCMDHYDTIQYLQNRYNYVKFYTYEDERVR